jgi:hypothetical protein
VDPRRRIATALRVHPVLPLQSPLGRETPRRRCRRSVAR